MSNTTPNESTSVGPAPIIVNVAAPEKKKVRHGLHLFLTIITAGLWLPVWIIVAIAA